MSIQSFGDEETADLFENGDVPKQGCGWKDAAEAAERKLDLLDAAEQHQDLWEPPSNEFKGVSGEGWYEISINDQWRIWFRWGDDDEGPEYVHITDPHD